MCGRFALFAGREELAKHFGVTLEDMEITPRYNVAPSQAVLAIRAGEQGGREAVRLHWGFVPSWAKDPSIGNRMINARADTAPEKPAFRAAFKSRRCLIPASGFYEWQATGGKGKQPYFIRAKDGTPLAFAGLWEHWRPGKDEPRVESCTILTTTANATMAPIHDRMPVILDPADYAAWLGEAPGVPPRLYGPCCGRLRTIASSPCPSRRPSTTPAMTGRTASRRSQSADPRGVTSW